jgi:transposase
MRFMLNSVVARYMRQHRISRPGILHDNTRSHKYQNVKAFFQRHRWEELKHPPYSPDLNPRDFDGIASIKRPLKGRRFTSEAGLVATNDSDIDEINRNESATGIQHLS